MKMEAGKKAELTLEDSVDKCRDCPGKMNREYG